MLRRLPDKLIWAIPSFSGVKSESEHITREGRWNGSRAAGVQ
jgi:hypothetical protein